VTKAIAAKDSLVIFHNGNNGVVIDTDFNIIVETGDAHALMASGQWDSPDKSYPQGIVDLAEGALTTLDVNVITASARMYTIPKGVQNEAKKALAWRKEYKRGGTPVGMNTARTLSKGGQVGLEKIRHIAKYFPRHEIDKKAKGYELGEDNFPSRGRIAWALWGGDSAWRWAQGIVDRENKKAVTADGYATPAYNSEYENYETTSGYMGEVSAFKEAHELDEHVGPEFLCRVRLDGSGIDRLYKIDLDGMVYVWDDSSWGTMGNVNSDVYAYDKELDEVYDEVQKDHVIIDADSAIIISARMQQQPFQKVSIADIDSFEAEMVANAAGEIDWTVIDYAITAAGEEPLDDGYSPEERSENATRQVRDSNGRFAAQGSRVVVGGDPNQVGAISRINPDDQSVDVKLDSGSTVNVPANSTQTVQSYINTYAGDIEDVRALDVSGILGEPRTPIDRPNAQIPGTLPALTAKDLQSVLYDWPAWVKSQRDDFKAAPESTPVEVGKMPDERPMSDDARTPLDRAADPKLGQYGDWLTKTTGQDITVDAYDHPMLKDWLGAKRRKNGRTTTPNSLWYQPVTAAAGEDTIEEITPENSDVQPLFTALVSPDDPRAVLDLIAIVPAGPKSNLPSAWKRKDKKWIRDEGIIGDLNSATPPPVVPLDSETLTSVLAQIDGEEAVTASAVLPLDFMLMVLWGPREDIMAQNYEEFMDDTQGEDDEAFGDGLGGIFAVRAAGGLDRNRGGAEKLRRYWLYGKGAAKIRWNTGGDWTRCVRYLSKYMGPRAKGYCSLRHKEATGLWTGDKLHRQLYGRKGGGKNLFSNDVIASTEQVVDKAVLNARMRDAKARVLTAGGLGEASYSGAKFYIPLVIPEQLESGDGRKFEKDAIEMRELPLPLLWQIKTADGHMGSVVVGRIDRMERTEKGIGNAYGVFDTGEFGQEAERLVREGFIRGVSADMDKFEAQEVTDEFENEDGEKVEKQKLNITQARVMAVTIVPKPAFQECEILIIDEEEKQEENMISDGVYVEDMDPTEAAAIVASGMVAAAIPVIPPKNWFQDPKLDKATPLTVDDEGRVYGHIAAWHVDHIGMSFGTRPPRSRSKYAYFHTGVVRTDVGDDMPVGQLTLAGGHASLEASAVDAARHYDDTASAIADVHAGEDAYGIWVAGALRPGTTPEQVRALRASAPSGDWRPVKGSLELVAVCQVNVPGFPIARARVASGQVMALVAAGANTLARMKSDPVAELASRIEKLEQLEKMELSAKIADVSSRFDEVRAQRRTELASKAEELADKMFADYDYDDGFGYIPRRTRKKLAQEGKALPDGSFPITNLDSLKDSISAYGRGKKSKRAAIRRHIMKRARQLRRPDLIPDKWKSMASDELSMQLDELRDRIGGVTASVTDEAVIETDASTELAGTEEAAKEGLIPTDESSKKALAAETKDTGAKYISGKTQPRDTKGKFRTVLARIKQNAGDSGLQNVIDKIVETENLDDAGNYIEAARSATDLIGIIDRIDTGALNPRALENVRMSARELGETIANLPLPFGIDFEKVRFSDLPPALRDLVDDMIVRVEDKIGKEDADVATENLRSYMVGGDMFNQSQISSELSKLLRLLT
jgi:hypothetical protein